MTKALNPFFGGRRKKLPDRSGKFPLRPMPASDRPTSQPPLFNSWPLQETSRKTPLFRHWRKCRHASFARGWRKRYRDSQYLREGIGNGGTGMPELWSHRQRRCLMSALSLSHRPVGELTNTGVGAMGLKRGRPDQFHWPLVGPQKGRLPLLVPWGLGPAPRGLATAP